MTKIIGLDAGHGLNTAGKRTPDGIREWTLNDRVRDMIVKILEAYDVKIIHTDNNEGKIDESLISRRNMYVNKKVDAFVSIHHNAHLGKWGSANGVEIYTDINPTAKDKELAKLIYSNLPKYTGLKGRGIKQADFTVINQDKIPAVLVEGGFMDNKADHKVITSSKGQEAYAKAVAEGLIQFLGLKKKTAQKPSTPSNTGFKPYEFKVANVKKGDTLNIREKPDPSSKKVGELDYNDPYKYTIIEEKKVGSQTWGLMKSGQKYKNRWINLYYTKKV